MDIAIVHYNTPELTGALLDSIRMFSAGARVTVFDNSDRRPLKGLGPGVGYIDNTRGQVLDFDAFLAQYPKNEPTSANSGSVKHTMSVDYLWDVLGDGFILLDSDVLLKRDVLELADREVAWTGQVMKGNWTAGGVHHPRLYPFVCWLNVPLCREHGIRYFDSERTWNLWPGQKWDTGASFWADCKRAGLPGREITWRDYVEHFGNGSWGGRDGTEWLRMNQRYFKK